MYDSPHPVSAANPVNGGAGDLVVDGSGTINPAALNNGMSLFFFFLVLRSCVCVSCNYYISCLPAHPLLLLFSFPHLVATDKFTPFCRAPPN